MVFKIHYYHPAGDIGEYFMWAQAKLESFFVISGHHCDENLQLIMRMCNTLNNTIFLHFCNLYATLNISALNKRTNCHQIVFSMYKRIDQIVSTRIRRLPEH